MTPTETPGGRDFAQIVREEGPGLLRFAHMLVRERAVAEDLVQDTFLRAYERRAQFRGDASVATWLHRILYRLVLDRARHSDRHAEAIDLAAVEDRWRDDSYTVDPEMVVDRAERMEELEDALVRLPFEYRAAVVLHDVDGWTAGDIASALDVSVEAAKKLMQRGRMALVDALAAGAQRRADLKDVPMRCWDARALVSDYLDGALDETARDLVERHLARCPTCPPLVAAVVGVTGALARGRDDDRTLLPALRERIQARLRAMT